MSGVGTSSCSATSTPVSYTGTAWSGTAISAATPVACDSGLFSVAANGNMVFTPNVIQRGVVVYNIEERRSGVLVGTSQREMTVLVMTCGAGAFPCISSGTTAVPGAAQDMHPVDIYPNPANDELTIKTGTGDYQTFTISNDVGQLMIQQQVTAAQTTVNIQMLPAGLYYITLHGNAGTQVRKFVKG